MSRMQALQQPGYRLVGIYAARRSGGRCRGALSRTSSPAPQCAWLPGQLRSDAPAVARALRRQLRWRLRAGGSGAAHSGMVHGYRSPARHSPGLGISHCHGAPPFSSSAPTGPACTGCMRYLKRAAVRWCPVLIISALGGVLMCSQALEKNLLHSETLKKLQPPRYLFPAQVFRCIVLKTTQPCFLQRKKILLS